MSTSSTFCGLAQFFVTVRWTVAWQSMNLNPHALVKSVWPKLLFFDFTSNLFCHKSVFSFPNFKTSQFRDLPVSRHSYSTSRYYSTMRGAFTNVSFIHSINVFLPSTTSFFTPHSWLNRMTHASIFRIEMSCQHCTKRTNYWLLSKNVMVSLVMLSVVNCPFLRHFVNRKKYPKVILFLIHCSHKQIEY